jgi:hypothetical protein
MMGKIPCLKMKKKTEIICLPDLLFFYELHRSVFKGFDSRQ